MDGARLNPKRHNNGQSAAKLNFKIGVENVQRLSREGVGSQAIGGSKWWALYVGEDIVHSASKDSGAKAQQGVASLIVM